jgi:hypothetical protein
MKKTSFVLNIVKMPYDDVDVIEVSNSTTHRYVVKHQGAFLMINPFLIGHEEICLDKEEALARAMESL